MNIARLLNNIKRLIKTFQNQKYAQNPNAPVLSREQYAALNIGTIMGEQNMYYCNCLETEPDKEDVASRLDEYYGIYDRESAIETLEHFLNRGHHIYYNAIKPVISNTSSEVDTSLLNEDEKETYLGTYISNIKETLESLVSYQVIKGGSEFKDIQAEAWDLARASFVARCCYDCGFITEEEAWNVIMLAYQKSKEIYPDWREFAKGYLVGRCMWIGEHYSNDGIFDIVDGLLNDDNSPWNRYRL